MKKKLFALIIVVFPVFFSWAAMKDSWDQAMDGPSNAARDACLSQLERIKIGTDESVVRNSFPKDLLCDVSSLVSESGVVNHYWVGYYDFDYGGCWTLATITCTNGKVTSVFYH